jgi:hypothetical protein
VTVTEQVVKVSSPIARYVNDKWKFTHLRSFSSADRKTRRGAQKKNFTARLERAQQSKPLMRP